MWTNLSRLQLRVRNRRLGSKRYELFCDPNFSLFSQSMLGCVLILLIVSMMYTPSNHGMAINRYISRSATPMPAALRDDAIRVTITRIRQRLQSGAQRKIFLVVDQRAQFGDLAIALDAARYAGIEDIAFLAEFPVMHR
jgi:hypothetical protein